MSILQTPARRVKNARLAPFGQGILPTRPTYKAAFSTADEQWLAADNARREARDRAYDRLAMEAAAADRIETGLCF